MEKPQAIANRGLRKETIEEVAKKCNGNFAIVAEYLNCTEELARALMIPLLPIRNQGGQCIFDNEELFQLAKEEAGFGDKKLPKLDKCFDVRWSFEAWDKIVKAGKEIIERTGSIYPPWKELK